MPITKKTPRARRTLTLADISINERIRWALGQSAVVGYFTRPRTAYEGTTTTIWPSWNALFEAYTAVRDDFLQSYYANGRHEGQTPGIERQYRYFMRGDDPNEARMPVERDPREIFTEMG